MQHKKYAQIVKTLFFDDRMGLNSVIKVADFGLTEVVYAQNYFRQDKDSTLKLPVKWMAPESLNDGLFTEASDVVCQSN